MKHLAKSLNCHLSKPDAAFYGKSIDDQQPLYSLCDMIGTLFFNNMETSPI